MRELQADDLLHELLVVLREQCPRLHVDSSWSPLKDHLVAGMKRLVPTKGFKVWESKKKGERKRGDGAYVWDISWTHEPDPPYWVELAGEIELTDQNREEILHDFYKVLDAKARLKVFVAAPPSRIKVQKLKDDIDWAIMNQRYQLPEERLVAILIIDGGKSEWDTAETRVFDGYGPLGRWKKGWDRVELSPPGYISG